jgi:hypothetical protein
MEPIHMSDPKLWTDMITAVWLVVMAGLVETHNTKSAMMFKVIPFALALVLAMSHAKAFF